MKKLGHFKVLIISLIVFSFLIIFNHLWLQGRIMSYKKVENFNELVSLFPKSPSEIKTLIHNSMLKIRSEMEKIVKLDPANRSYENTIRAYDKLVSYYSLVHSTISVVKFTHADGKIRMAAEEALAEGEKQAIDLFESKEIYKSFIDYGESNKSKEDLTKVEGYFFEERLKDFKRAGLALDDAKFEEVQNIKKELSILSLKFHTNINTDQRKTLVEENELLGLSPDFITKLEKKDGKYILGCDYPTYFEVMENCSVSKTREKHWVTFNNLAYPVNEEILNKIIELRDRVANIIGFESYALLDIDGQMAKKPSVVEKFISNLMPKSMHKMNLEFEEFIKDLPDGIELINGKLKPWDFMYLKTYFKKKNFSLDERLIAEYFPMEKTLNGLFGIYQKFLSLEFDIQKTNDFWHEDLSLITVYTSGRKKFLGYIILDLFPRPNKYTHACMCPIIGPMSYKDKETGENFERPAVAVVIANFTKPTNDKPSLLKHDEVKTFFHEFGHAMHQILGTTELASFAGTSTKTDFVEMPSQMFEEWIWDRDILKSLSSHYLNGASLSDKLIDAKIALKKFDSGFFVTRQLILSLMSLNFYLKGAHKDIQEITKDLNLKHNSNMIWDDRNHTFASFGHLVSYDSKYYSYMWSKVFALDLFDKVKKNGLLNPLIGQEFVDKVLGKGGEVDPETLLEDFLGRKPNDNAFFADMGLI